MEKNYPAHLDRVNYVFNIMCGEHVKFYFGLQTALKYNKNLFGAILGSELLSNGSMGI